MNQMKLLVLGFAVVATVVLCSVFSQAQNPNNPLEVALLRWYQANMATQISTCSSGTGSPKGMAFDGSHIWVACENNNEVQEFNASVVGPPIMTVSVPTPYALVYDGANIWVADYLYGEVEEINAITGSVRTGSGFPVPVGTNPIDLVFDGTNIWVTNYGSNSISKILATTGAVTTYALGSSCPTPDGIAFDGTHLWIACHTANQIVEVNPSTGGVLNTVMVQQAPISVMFDGETSQTNGPFIWVTNNSSSTVSKISVTNLSVTNFSANATPYGIAFDGLYVWVTNPPAGTVTKLLQSTGAIVGTYSTGGTAPTFLGFDGGNIYVSNVSSATISKM
jgi:hypothetical protein